MSTVTVPQKKIASVLLALRLGVFLVLAMWTLDKFVNPGHTAAVFAKFYMTEGLSTGLVYAIGALQAAIILSFLVGFKKRWSTGLVLAMHAVSTLAPMASYFSPWSNLLFFAAWPMLAAIVALYVLRDYDTYLSVETSKASDPKLGDAVLSN